MIAMPPKIWTEPEIETLPEDGYIHEIVDGELIMSPKNNWFHGRICTRLLFAIETFNRAHRLGAVLDSSTGFWMSNRNCRAPDVSFVCKARLTALGFKPNERRFFPGAPDLAVEVLSENNTRAEIDQRNSVFPTELFRKFMSVNVSPSRTGPITQWFALSRREGVTLFMTGAQVPGRSAVFSSRSVHPCCGAHRRDFQG